MKTSLVLAVMLTGALGFARAAGADQTECPIAQIGQACGSNGSTCIDATCCDDPNGCAYDAGPSSGGSSSGTSSGSSGSGGSTGTGVSRACAMCEFIGGEYCSPADLGKACPGDAGVCGSYGGGGGPATALDGGTTNVGFEFTICGAPEWNGDDGGTGFGTSSSSGSSSGSGGGTLGGSGGSSSGSSGSSGSSSSSSGSSGAGSAGDAGTENRMVTAGCEAAPIAPHEGPWGVGACVGLGLVAVARRRRRSGAR